MCREARGQSHQFPRYSGIMKRFIARPMSVVFEPVTYPASLVNLAFIRY